MGAILSKNTILNPFVSIALRTARVFTQVGLIAAVIGFFKTCLAKRNESVDPQTVQKKVRASPSANPPITPSKE